MFGSKSIYIKINELWKFTEHEYKKNPEKITIGLIEPIRYN